MAVPTSALAQIRPDLAAPFMEFDLEMNRRGFIGQRVFPTLDVATVSGKFPRLNIEDLLEERETSRAPGAGYARGRGRFRQDSYLTEEHGAEEVVDDNEAAMYGAWIDAEMLASARAFDAVLMNAEKRIAATVFDTATWTGAPLTTGASVPWTTPASAVPITDINAARIKIRNAIGMPPNALIMDWTVFVALREVVQIIDRIKYSGLQDPTTGGITISALSQVFDIPNIIISSAMRNTATQETTATLAPTWDPTLCMVCRIAETRDLREPCIGRTMHWAGDGSRIDGRFESYRDETVRADIVRVRHQTDEKRLYVEAGHLLTAVTA